MRPIAEVAFECALAWQQRYPASAAVPPDEDAVGNSGAASSSFDPGGNHTGQEGSTPPINQQCPLKPVPDSIALLNVAGLRKACHKAGIATKIWVQSADGRNRRIHVAKDLLQTKLAAKDTVQESAPVSADAPESSCASDNDKTSWRQNRTSPCPPEPGFANSFSADCSETSVSRAPLVPCDAPSGSGFVLSAPSASGKHTPVDRIPLRYQDLRRECQRVGIPITIVQDSRLGWKRHVFLRKDELTRKLAAKVLCAPGCQDTQVDHSWNMHQLRKECQRVGIGLTHSEDTMDGRRRYVCLRKKDLVRQLAAHYVLKEKLHCTVISPKCHGQRHRLGGDQRWPASGIASLRRCQDQKPRSRAFKMGQ